MMRFFRELLILGLGGFALLYLLLPSLLPDFLIGIGWIDEGIATTIILSVLKHYGLDLTGLFGRDKVEVVTEAPEQAGKSTSAKTKKIRIPRAVLEQAIQDYQRQQSSAR